MNILETIIIYWNEFETIYDIVLKYSAWKTVSVFLPSLLMFGLVRCAYHYAKGNNIGKFYHSMFVLRLADKFLTLVGGQDITEFRRDAGWSDNGRKRIYEPIPIGSHLLGMILDCIVLTVISLILFLIWPVVAFISVTVGPLHICRVHNLRKKMFIANLKGEEASNA